MVDLRSVATFVSPPYPADGSVRMLRHRPEIDALCVTVRVTLSATTLTRELWLDNTPSSPLRPLRTVISKEIVVTQQISTCRATCLSANVLTQKALTNESKQKSNDRDRSCVWNQQLFPNGNSFEIILRFILSYVYPPEYLLHDVPFTSRPDIAMFSSFLDRTLA